MREFLELLILSLPAYVANASPVVLGGGPPIDFGKTFIDGRPIFGRNKTWRGLICGILCGVLMGFPVYILLKLCPVAARPLDECLWLAFLASSGAHVGDLLGSFIKRRLGLKPGAPAPLLDQVLWIVCAIGFLSLAVEIDLLAAVLLVVLSAGLHVGANVLAFKLGLKEHPW